MTVLSAYAITEFIKPLPTESRSLTSDRERYNIVDLPFARLVRIRWEHLIGIQLFGSITDQLNAGGILGIGGVNSSADSLALICVDLYNGPVYEDIKG